MKTKHGYTLIELLVVAGIAILLLSISTAGYHTWMRSTSSQTADTLLKAELTRARSYALARCCTTRVLVVPRANGLGNDIISERIDSEKEDRWYPIGRTNFLKRIEVDPTNLFFRADGSCCIEADEIHAIPALDYIDLSYWRTGERRESFAWIPIDARSGLCGNPENEN